MVTPSNKPNPSKKLPKPTAARFQTQIDPQDLLESCIEASDLGGITRALEAGAEVNFTKEVFEIKGPHYLVLSHPLWLATQVGGKDVVNVVGHLIENGAKPSDYKTYDLASKGSTLIKALELGGQRRNEVVKLLLSAGASPKEGQGAVLDNIDWSLGTKAENEELRGLLAVSKTRTGRSGCSKRAGRFSSLSL